MDQTHTLFEVVELEHLGPAFARRRDHLRGVDLLEALRVQELPEELRASGVRLRMDAATCIAEQWLFSATQREVNTRLILAIAILIIIEERG